MPDIPEIDAWVSAAAARMAQAEASADLAAATAAVRMCKRVVAATPAGHRDWARHESSLCVALRIRFGCSRDVADIDDAIEGGRLAVAATAANLPDSGKPLSNLSLALQRQFAETGDMTCLDEAIQTVRQAVDVTRPGHANYGKYSLNLSTGLQTRYKHSGKPADLDETIAAQRQAVAATAGHPNEVSYLSSLASALEERYERAGNLTDLDDAVAARQQAAAATPAGSRDLPGVLSNLGVVLQIRFERSGKRADLNAAVDAGRLCVAATPADHPERCELVSNLGNALWMRFDQTGSLDDLDEAVTTGRQAVACIPDGHPNGPSVRINLSSSLMRRFERTGDLADIEEAVKNDRLAVAASLADDPQLPANLANLCGALVAAYERSGDLADIDDAVRTGQQSVAVTPGDHSSMPGYLSMLGAALWVRVGGRGDPADIDGAVEAQRQAVAGTPADHPDRTLYLDNLRIALQIRMAHSRSAADAAEALAACTEAVNIAAAPPSLRIKAARAAAALAEGMDNVAEAARLLETAVLLLPESSPRQLDPRDQQHALAGLAGLPGQAAALALADEDGGSIQDRAIRALRLRDQLDVPARSAGLSTTSSEHGAPDRHRLAAEFTALQKEIRALKGFGTFLLPPSTERLLGEAAEGPIVVFTIDSRRSDAILLHRDGAITALQLPGLGADALRQRVVSFHQALGTARDPAAGSKQRRAAQRTLHEILEWLWDNAAGPVLDELSFRKPPAPGDPYPRVWWVPGGLLGLLPIHAAGYHREEPSPDAARRTVMDRVVSSYAPTIRALRHARERRTAQSASMRSLIVAMPTTPGAAPLSNVVAEAANLHSRLPHPELLMEGGGAAGEPTLASVLEHLTRCSIAHFACHGHSDPADPSLSRLLLHDRAEPLTVTSLAPVSLDHAELAYLSACETALNSVTGLLDEAIHLTSAFQMAGFPPVIGTLWEVNDAIAVRVADAFYTGLDDESGALDTASAAAALHQAVRAERDTLFRTPSLWAAYMHAGA